MQLKPLSTFTDGLTRKILEMDKILFEQAGIC